MKIGGWRWQDAITAATLVAAQWVAMPVSAQTISALAAAPTGAAQAVSTDATPALESSFADPRWCRFKSTNGIVSHINRQSVKPQPDAAADASSHTVYFRLLRNVPPDFTIRITDGQPIRPSVKQAVLDCARHSHTVIAQMLYRARNAIGEPLYQIHHGDEAQNRSLREGSVFEWIVGRLCGADH